MLRDGGKESHGAWRACDREEEASSTDWKRGSLKQMGGHQEERQAGRSSWVPWNRPNAFHRVWGATGEHHGSSREVSLSPGKFHGMSWGCRLCSTGQPGVLLAP